MSFVSSPIGAWEGGLMAKENSLRTDISCSTEMLETRIRRKEHGGGTSIVPSAVVFLAAYQQGSGVTASS